MNNKQLNIKHLKLIINKDIL